MKFMVGDSKYKMGEVIIKADVVTKLGPNKWKIIINDSERTVEYKSETFLSPSQRTIAYVCLY